MRNRKINHIVALMLLVSCTPSDNKSSADITHTGVKATMLSKSGELFENNHYLPLPLNHAFIVNDISDTLDILILGKPIEEKNTYFKPFALIDLMEYNKVRKIVLGLPELQKYGALENEDFSDFMIKNHAIKTIIDAYFSNFKGLGVSRISRWQDDFKAEEYVNSFQARVTSTETE